MEDPGDEDDPGCEEGDYHKNADPEVGLGPFQVQLC